MSVESEFNRFLALQTSLGKKALNALFPNDFEVYIFALELVNGNQQTEDYFIFPVNPSSFDEGKTPNQNIKKTAGGITILNDQTFNPSTISLTGNFGRQLKFLIGSEAISFASITVRPTIGENAPTFNSKIKTGYGCCKLVEKIINKSNTIDQKTGLPYALYFHNLAFGNSYLIKALNFKFYQSQENNILWNYNFQFKSLARVEDITNRTQRSMTIALSATSAIQNRVNAFGNSIKAAIKDVAIPDIIDNIESFKNYI